MCNVLVLDDNPRQFAWIVDTVANVLRSAGKFTLFPRDVESCKENGVKVPPRNQGFDVKQQEAWVAEILKSADLADDCLIDIAIVDLCLTNPPQLRDPEGLWICSSLRKRFPKCFIILVSSKSKVDSTLREPPVSGGWFKHVPDPPVRIDEVVGIREDNPGTSRSQLAAAVREMLATHSSG